MWTFPLRLEGIHEIDAWKTRRGEIDVRIMGSGPEPIVLNGQRVYLKGELQKRNYPRGNSVGMKVPNANNCTILSSSPRYSPLTWGRAWRESAAIRLEQGVEGMPVQQAVLKALVLGYRNEIPSGTLGSFRRTGSLHIFAISGLHVGIVGLLLVIVLKSIGISRDWFGIWLLPLLFLYVVATGMKASALRAMVMAGVFLLAPLLRRKPDIPTSIAFAAILLLFLDPLEIRSAGFIFSFVVVAFIVMVYSAIPDALLKGGWARSYGLSLVITSFAASLASLPLTAYYFGRFSPVALLGNLFVVPLTFCIVLSGWLSIIIPMASAVFNLAAVVFINVMLGAVAWFDRIPGSSWKVDRPPLMAMALWYCSLVYFFVHASRRKHRVYALAGVGCAVLWAALA